MIIPYYFKRCWGHEAKKEEAMTQASARTEGILFVDDEETRADGADRAGKPRVSADPR